MNNNTFDPLLLIDFLFAICCLQSDSDSAKEIPSSLSFLHTDFVKDLQYCSPAISDTVRDKARDVLFSAINLLAVRTDDSFIMLGN